jgi:hypothetical protein
VVRRLYGLPWGRDQEGRRVPVVLELGADARPLWAAWYDEHAAESEAAGFPAVLVGPWSKMVAYAARLALVMHLLRQACGEEVGQAVDAESLRRAIRLITYFKSHARAVYARLGQSETSRRVAVMLNWIVGHGGEAHTSALTKNNVAGVENRDEALSLMKEMEHRGYGHLVKRKAANGREVTYFVVPASEPNRPKSGTGSDLYV